MRQNKAPAAFRVNQGGNLDLSTTTLMGFDGVVDADKIGNIKVTQLIADVKVRESKRSTKFIVAVSGAVIAAVIAGIILHKYFGIG